jgi:hypothetical protein
MKKITASRISDGNKLFPASITIEDTGLKVRLPGFWKDEETFVSYTDISGVSVDTPLIGYSSIEFNVMGSRVKAHGFTKSEVKEIKQAIDDGKRRGPVVSSTNYSNPTGANASGGENITVVNKGDGFLTTGVKTLGGLYGQLLDDTAEREAKAKLEGRIDDVTSMTFGTDANEIGNQLNQLVSLGSTKPDKALKNAIIEKVEFGIMKLKGLGANAEADFFEKKLEPLKKKSWF